ncbi:MAG: cysteine synthase A [Clostridiales bacterium]|nr:cysteine synthase A [Clostridiales bacterium]
MTIHKSINTLIGNTPLLQVVNYSRANGLCAAVFAKLEYLNPCGSVKDRIAAAIIDHAEASGRLKAGGTVIEPTSGNTGIALAAVAAARGYNMIVVMPDSMSVERRNIIKAYGAQVVLTDGKQGMKGAIQKAEELAQKVDDAIIAGQFDNPQNPLAHYRTTGPEIWRDMDGKVDIFVTGVGTGGTITGVGKYLKERNANIRIVAVEPSNSPMLSQGKSGAHRIQGIGAGFIPSTLDASIIDEVVTVTDDDAFCAAKSLARTEGVLCGISSGAALHAATVIAQRKQNIGKNIVTILPDSADRYYSTSLFDN